MAKSMANNIDGQLLRQAQKLTGLKKTVDVVNLALLRLVRQKEIEGLLDLPGKIEWEGDLREMRRTRQS